MHACMYRNYSISQPFIKVYYDGVCHHETAVQEKNLNPTWNEALKIHSNNSGPPKNKNGNGSSSIITFFLYDYDVLSDPDNMGCISIPVAEYMDKPPTTAWFPVQKTSDDVDYSTYNCSKAKGKIQISISISVRKRLNVKRGNYQDLSGIGMIQVQLNWDLKERIDLDTSCVGIDSTGRVLMDETVYFADLVNSNGSIRHSGDIKTGGNKGELIDVNLDLVPRHVMALYFILCVATPGKTFTDVESADIVVRKVVHTGTDAGEGAGAGAPRSYNLDVCRFVPTFAGGHTSMFLMRIARQAGTWKMTIIEDTDHTARDFGSLIPEIKGYSRDLVPGIAIDPKERIAVMRKGGIVCLEEKMPEKMTFGLSWDVTNGVNIDLDASAICLDADLEPVDIISFRKLRSDDNSIIHCGDEREGDAVGDDEKINLYLDNLNPRVKHIAFVINSFSGQELDDIRRASCHLFNPTFPHVDIAKYKLANNGDLDKRTGLIVATLYRNELDGWCLRIIAEAAIGRQASDLVDELQRFLRKFPPPLVVSEPEPDIIVNKMPEEVDIEVGPL
uniref:C2 domain-containing protein n=1 Tax=Chaetoceros debilis TaxID=122233 RepID=A0A7S3V4R7_9STRA